MRQIETRNSRVWYAKQVLINCVNNIPFGYIFVHYKVAKRARVPRIYIDKNTTVYNVRFVRARNPQWYIPKIFFFLLSITTELSIVLLDLLASLTLEYTHAHTFNEENFNFIKYVYSRIQLCYIRCRTLFSFALHKSAEIFLPCHGHNGTVTIYNILNKYIYIYGW